MSMNFMILTAGVCAVCTALTCFIVLSGGARRAPALVKAKRRAH